MFEKYKMTCAKGTARFLAHVIFLWKKFSTDQKQTELLLLFYLKVLPGTKFRQSDPKDRQPAMCSSRRLILSNLHLLNISG